jgi:uncharacterized membrane protein YhaH (DUF805 family)
VDYWLAGHLGRVWLRLRKDRRQEDGDLPGLCASVARGAILPARTLWRVQDFAVMIWLGVGVTPMVFLLAAGVAAKALSGGAIPFAIVVGVTSPLVIIFGIAAGQMVAIKYRANRVRLYLIRADRAAGALPLPAGSQGLPQRSDFWIALVLAVIVVAVLLLSGFRAAPT